jgi:CRISPR-associated protein Cmr1
MKTLEATYRIITPMFIGDAEQKATDLRPPSIKGALRFWWRALNWKNVDSLKDLHEKESRLFGSAATDNDGGGQGCFLLQVTLDSDVKPLEPKILLQKYPLHNQNGYIYLLGQGLYQRAQARATYLRSALPATSTFKISLCFRRNADKQQRKSMAETLLLFGMMGGLGSRGRRGFGSIAIQELDGDENYQVPKNIEEYKMTLKEMCQSLPVDLPPFTAFSKESRIDVSLTGNNAQELLNNIGSQMNSYRSFKSQEKNFKLDHDLAYDITQGNPVTKHPKRVVFGLPHNYFFTSIKPAKDAKVDVNPVHQKGRGWTSEGRGRRASPLFIHLHQFPDNQNYIAIQALLPAVFLPDSDRIEMKGSAKTCQIPHNIDWQVIHHFLDRFTTRTRII